jgi:hypothetical protein
VLVWSQELFKSYRFFERNPGIYLYCPSASRALLTKRMANREQAERSSELHGFRRRYPKTKNYWIVTALNSLLQEHGLSQFCVEEVERSASVRGAKTIESDERVVCVAPEVSRLCLWILRSGTDKDGTKIVLVAQGVYFERVACEDIRREFGVHVSNEPYRRPSGCQRAAGRSKSNRRTQHRVRLPVKPASYDDHRVSSADASRTTRSITSWAEGMS